MSASWLADKIEQWPTAKLLPYARNARTHSDDQVAQIAASIAGLASPIRSLQAVTASSSLGMAAWPLRRNSGWKSCPWSYWIT